MTITGNIKVFELSKSLSKNGATATATSGNVSAVNVLDFNKVTRYQSVGSDDSTTVTFIITFPEPVDITRLLIINHNWRAFNVKATVDTNLLDNFAEDILDNLSSPIEDDGAGVLEFQNVVSITDSVPSEGIVETDYSLSSSYYEFDSMYAEGLVIEIDTAQELHDEGDQEKYCFNIIPTIEVNDNQGTFELFPVLTQMKDFQALNNRIQNGLYDINKQLAVFAASLTINLGGSEGDAALFEHMRYRDGSFIIWPNGGKNSDYFRFQTRPYRFEDFYQVQAMDAGMLTYIGNIYSNPQVAPMIIRETV